MNKDRMDRLVREASVAPPHAFVEDMFTLAEIVRAMMAKLRRGRWPSRGTAPAVELERVAS